MHPAQMVGMVVIDIIRRIQEHRNKDKTITLTCKRCHFKGNHKFAYIWPSFSPLKPIGNKVFRCEKCGVEMYENGEIIVTFFDRVEGFIHYPEIMQAINDLELMVTQNQEIASKYSKEILNLKNELLMVNSDKEFILIKLKELFSKIKKETV